ncbi:acyltransferase [Shewanella sp. 125m-7]
MSFKNICFDTFVRVFMGYVKLARMKGVNIGTDCRIYISYWGTEPNMITIGDNVTVARGVEFLTHDGSYCLVKDKDGKRKYSYKPIKIGSNVFIGVNSIILPGVSIGDNVVIGAGSIVSRSINANSVALGCPARIIKSFDDFEANAIECGTNEQIK